ncbi:MAG: hypothetical protein A3F16_02425 [Deltaproteobacteria bacterium RIFCSPHIGHO2_12_FULL_43_9]|nr:MAG: hypothetical protein A3F16_02425 [Deltaproteobacteria bacterium RIFCSPHIGHO2_12_FULL_43_9]
MKFKLLFTNEASHNLHSIKSDKGLEKRLKAVRKTLGYLETNPRHPSLNTHKYYTLLGPNGMDVFEAYAESNTPAAYRIFWCYGPGKHEITILAITSHP